MTLLKREVICVEEVLIIIYFQKVSVSTNREDMVKVQDRGIVLCGHNGQASSGGNANFECLFEKCVR
jgi:hypothetical protein